MSASKHQAPKLLVTLSAAMMLSACESANNGGQLADLPPDTTPPEIVATVPSISVDEVALESDQAFRVFFSELLTDASVTAVSPSGDNVQINLRYAPNSANADVIDDSLILEQAEIGLEVSQYLRNIADPITELPKDILSSVVTINPPTSGYDLDSYYTLTFNQGIKDRSAEQSLNPANGNYEAGNFLARTEAYQFVTNKGYWRSEALIPTPLNNEVLSFNISNANQPYLLWNDFDSRSQRYQNRIAKYNLPTKQWQNLNGTNLSTASAQSLLLPEQGDNSQASFQLQITQTPNDALVSAWLQNNNQARRLRAQAQLLHNDTWQSLNQVMSSSDASANIIEYQLIAYKQAFYFMWLEHGANGYRLLSQALVSNDQSGYQLQTPTELHQSALPLSELKIREINTAIVIAWKESQQYKASLYKPNTGIDPLTRFETPAGSTAQHLAMGFNTSGEGYLSWQQFDGLRQNIWRSRLSQERFGPAELVEQNNFAEALNGSVASCFDNNTAVFWLQEDNNKWQLLSSRYDKESGWSAQRVQDNLDIASKLDIELSYDDSCNLHASWVDRSTQSFRAVYYSSRRGAWSALVRQDALIGTNPLFSGTNKLSKIGQTGRYLNLRLVDVDGRKQLAHSLYDE